VGIAIVIATVIVGYASMSATLKKKKEGPSICIARRREYTSNALSSLKLSREAVQVTAHSLRTQAPCSDPTTGHRQRQPAVGLHSPPSVTHH